MPEKANVLPHPTLSGFLLVLWLLLNNSAAPGHLFLGALLGFLIPLFTQRFWPDRLILARPGLMLRFAGRVLWDIIAANFAVARVVPKRHARSLQRRVRGGGPSLDADRVPWDSAFREPTE